MMKRCHHILQSLALFNQPSKSHRFLIETHEKEKYISEPASNHTAILFKSDMNFKYCIQYHAHRGNNKDVSIVYSVLFALSLFCRPRNRHLHWCFTQGRIQCCFSCKYMPGIGLWARMCTNCEKWDNEAIL